MFNAIRAIAIYCKRALLLTAAISLLTACAVPASREMQFAAPIPAEDAKKSGWWRASFAIAWPQDQEPLWHMDELLAHRIVAPVLNRYRRHIQYWRFHRRAARDAAGHRFSFIFYAPAETAGKIFAALHAEPRLQVLLSEKQLLSADYDDPHNNAAPRIEDGGDPVWPLMVRKIWPHYMTGASEMWLGLIGEMAVEAQQTAKLDDDRLYRDIHARIGALWREQGQHAFLHHLNALFGYEEMIVIDRNGKAMRF